MVQETPHPSKTNTARAHQTAPTILYLSASPKPQPPTTGPSVLAAEVTLCATPCTVPSTLGSVTELLTRIIAAGSENVLEMT
ncbi:hypothetical protein ACKS0A_07852 [Histoplasma ohiense]